MTIAERWAAVRARVDAACARAGRAPGEVTLIAVSKTHGADAIREALAAGATDFGENYAQELVGKRAELAIARSSVPDSLIPGSEVGVPRWHFIGRLQRNKAKAIAGQVALVHAVDSLELAQELGKRAGAAGQAVLIAVNAAGEATKGGVPIDAAAALVRAVIAGAPGVRLDGLMTMPPPSDDPEASRPHFEAVRALAARLRDDTGAALPILSMGMSDDFEVAIASGATHVRVGTAIFGTRPPG